MTEKIRSLLESLTGFGSSQMEDIGPGGLFVVLVVSLLCSVFIAHLYKYFFSGRSTGSQIHRAFPLLAISVTAIFITIQFSLPLSLGLLGALSIVRFRTPIKEPEEIGFLMLVIAASLICATFNYTFLGVMLMVALGGLLLLHSGWLNQGHEECLVVVTLGKEDYQERLPKLMEYLGANTIRGKLDSLSKTGDAAVVAYSFSGVGKTTISELQAGLDQLVGGAAYDIFLNQQRVA